MALSVIGAGFGRTGTESMKLALEMLGLGPCHLEQPNCYRLTFQSRRGERGRAIRITGVRIGAFPQQRFNDRGMPLERREHQRRHAILVRHIHVRTMCQQGIDDARKSTDAGHEQGRRPGGIRYVWIGSSSKQQRGRLFLPLTSHLSCGYCWTANDSGCCTRARTGTPPSCAGR